MDTSAITDYTMKAKCTHCGYDFSDPVPILTVNESTDDSHYRQHQLCPKCLYIDCIEIEHVKREVPLDWQTFEKHAHNSSEAEKEAYYKMFGEVAIETRINSKDKTISFTYDDEKYGKHTVDMVIMRIRVYLEHQQIVRRFYNLKGREALIEKYMKCLQDIKDVRVYAHSKIYTGNELLDVTQEHFEEFIVELKKLM